MTQFDGNEIGVGESGRIVKKDDWFFFFINHD